MLFRSIHTLVGAGGGEGAMDAANILKPALARGELRAIGATTLNEYQKYFEKDKALERRFQKVILDPSTKAETIEILKNVKDKYETHHKVSYSDEIINTCVELADRYITDREFPDKAFDILDEVGSRCQIDTKLPQAIEDLKAEAAKIKQDKMVVVKSQNYEAAAELRDREKRVLEKLSEEKRKFEEQSQKEKKEVK
mgnify:CR=1 FL=1